MTHEPITTTLAEIRSYGPCEDGFAKIRNHLGVSPADAKTHDQPFPLSLLLETNNLDDCLWVTAHVVPDAVTRFLIKRLDTGKHSALKTLRHLNGDFSEQVCAVENVVSLLKRKLVGESVESDLKDAARAADAAYAAADAAYAAAAYMRMKVVPPEPPCIASIEITNKFGIYHRTEVLETVVGPVSVKYTTVGSHNETDHDLVEVVSTPPGVVAVPPFQELPDGSLGHICVMEWSGA